MEANKYAMSKLDIFAFLDKEGITETAIRYPDTPKTWVMEWLYISNYSYDMKEYYQIFINENFK